MHLPLMYKLQQLQGLFGQCTETSANMEEINKSNNRSRSSVNLIEFDFTMLNITWL